MQPDKKKPAQPPPEIPFPGKEREVPTPAIEPDIQPGSPGETPFPPNPEPEVPPEKEPDQPFPRESDLRKEPPILQQKAQAFTGKMPARNPGLTSPTC